MRTTAVSRLLLVSLALGLSSAGGVRADDDDHELARRLVDEGKIRALSAIIEEVKTQVPGEMLEIEFESEKGVYKYELKILRPDGKVQEVDIDAVTGSVLKVEDDD